MRMLNVPIYINQDYINNDKGCAGGFRRYYGNLLKGDSESILKEKCVKVLLFVNKKNLKIFMGYSPKCGLYILVKSPLLKNDNVLPCSNDDYIDAIEDLRDELDRCKEQNKNLLRMLSQYAKSTNFAPPGKVEILKISRFTLMKDSYLT